MECLLCLLPSCIIRCSTCLICLVFVQVLWQALCVLLNWWNRLRKRCIWRWPVYMVWRKRLPAWLPPVLTIHLMCVVTRLGAISNLRKWKSLIRKQVRNARWVYREKCATVDITPWRGIIRTRKLRRKCLIEITSYTPAIWVLRTKTAITASPDVSRIWLFAVAKIFIRVR